MKNPSSTYIANEIDQTRQPVEIYHFWRDGGDDVYYTDGDVSFTYNGNTYSPVPITRGKTLYDTSLSVSKLEMQISIEEDPIPSYLSHNPVEVIWIQVDKLFRDQSPAEGSCIFLGQIRLVNIQGLLAKISCVGFEFFLKQQIPKWVYGPTCNHSLFDDNCGIDNSSSGGYKISATLSAVSSEGFELTSADFGESGLDEGFFTNGEVVFNEYHRMIVEHTGTKVKIRYAIPDLEASDTIDAYAGCDGSIETCRDKFDNVDNFGGHFYIPLDNPATWD